MAVPALLLAAAAAVVWPVDPATTGVLVEDHRAAVVTIVVELPVGAWSPWFRKAHGETAFLFQDSDRAKSLQRRADELGATLDLGVGDRASVVSMTVLAGDLDAAAVLVKDVFANRDYDHAKIARMDRQQKVAWRSTETDVDFRLGQSAARSLFADADPRRQAWERPEPLEGEQEALAAARDAILRLPGRLVGFAGDITPERAKELAATLLPPASEAPAAVAPKLLPLRTRQDGASDTTIPIRNLTQVYFALARESVPWDDPRRPAFLVADHVLGGHFYSRLYVALRHEGGETYGATTDDDGDAAAGCYRLYTFTRAGNAGPTEAKLREVLRVFHDGGITEAERAAATAFLTGSLGFSRQSPRQILSRFRLERRNGLAPGALDDAVARAARLPLAEINAFIRDYYDPKRFALFEAVPR